MNSVVLAAHGAEHTAGMLNGIPTYVYGIVAAVVFTVLLLITLSYSGRGIVRPDHTPELMEGDEAQALRSYSEKHNH